MEVIMSNIAIYTDSTADFSKQWLKENDVKCISLTYNIDDEEFEDNTEPETIKAFYDKIREGKMPKTSAASMMSFLTAFEKELKAGRDVFYTGLSGKLSVTYNNACMARDELNSKYNNKVYTVDSLATASPLAHYVSTAVQMRNEGRCAQEIADTVSSMTQVYLAWAGVDDLMHLKRGGRVSGVSAAVGSILNIKPVLILDEEGGLVLKDKIKGNKKLTKYYLDKINEFAVDYVNEPVFIMHSDNFEAAEALKTEIQNTFGTKNVPINNIGTIIGTHLGPGSLIISFHAKCTRTELNK